MFATNWGWKRPNPCYSMLLLGHSFSSRDPFNKQTMQGRHYAMPICHYQFIFVPLSQKQTEKSRNREASPQITCSKKGPLDPDWPIISLGALDFLQLTPRDIKVALEISLANRGDQQSHFLYRKWIAIFHWLSLPGIILWSSLAFPGKYWYALCLGEWQSCMCSADKVD